MTLRLTNFLILAAVFCFGVATLALLPPFEAFDEAEYWSVIQDDADTGVLPRLSEARVSQDAVAYPGPLPASSGQPYAAYFAKKSAALAGPTRFVPSDVPNYEAQHPPLFFVLMRPVYRAAAGLNWPEHFFVLRLVNWIIAFAGFAIGALATQGVLRRRGASALWVPLAWPLMFPQFFEEFARVTNDTLCLLIMGLVWWLLMTPGKWRGVGIGTLLGAGLLTKAFFLPVTLGVVALLAVVAWRQAVVVAVIAAALGGWWYVQAALSTGHVTGASDFIQARVHFSWDMPGLYLAGIFRILLGGELVFRASRPGVVSAGYPIVFVALCLLCAASGAGFGGFGAGICGGAGAGGVAVSSGGDGGLNGHRRGHAGVVFSYFRGAVEPRSGPGMAAVLLAVGGLCRHPGCGSGLDAGGVFQRVPAARGTGCGGCAGGDLRDGCGPFAVSNVSGRRFGDVWPRVGSTDRNCNVRKKAWMVGSSPTVTESR
jgi:hypothetical protein